MSDSEGSVREDDYYDQEDYYEEVSPPTRPLPEEEKKKEGEETGEVAEEAVGEEEPEVEAVEPPGRLVMNVYCSHYESVKKVARRDLKYKLRWYAEDQDGAIRKGRRN